MLKKPLFLIFSLNSYSLYLMLIIHIFFPIKNVSFFRESPSCSNTTRPSGGTRWPRCRSCLGRLHSHCTTPERSIKTQCIIISCLVGDYAAILRGYKTKKRICTFKVCQHNLLFNCDVLHVWLLTLFTNVTHVTHVTFPVKRSSNFLHPTHR